MSDSDSADSESPLGKSRDLFRPGLANVVAGIILSLLLIGGGLTIAGFVTREVYRAGGNLPVSVEHGMSWIAAGMGWLLGLGLSIGGVFLGRYAWRLKSHRVEVCEYGFRYWMGGAADEVLWSEVAAIRETIRHERPPILKGPAKFLLPKFTSSRYEALTRAGKQYQFDRNSIGEMLLFEEILREVGRVLHWRWETIEEHA